MNYSYGTSASETFNSNNNARLIESYGNECYMRNKSLFEATTSLSHNSSENLINHHHHHHHQFDCLINETSVNIDTIANENKTDEDILQSSVSSSSNSSSSSSFSYNMNNVSNRFNHQHQHTQLQHQLNQQNMQQTNGNSNLDYSYNSNSSPSNSYLSNKKFIKQDTTSLNEINYVSDKNQASFANDSKFQYVLLAPTSPAVKTNEDTLTYLNQGQNYELRLSFTDPVSINSCAKTFDNNGRPGKNNSNYIEDIKPLIINGKPNVSINDNNGNNNNNGQNKFLLNDSNDAKTYPVYLSIIRLCFWDRKLQESEHHEIKEWEKEYQNVRMLEIDGNSSYGTIDLRVSEMYTNAAEVIWNGNTGASIFFRCNCTSTAFAPHKHGGEKGIHMRFQIDTFEFNSTFNNSNNNISKNANSGLSVNCNQSDLQSSSSASILSPPNSASSPIQTHKFSVKDDMDPSFNNQTQNNQRLPTPSSLNDYSNWAHSCSSYCRIQLFRLKGAQRKLKTDRNKIEKLNPSDLRRRYQPSSKITLLYNGPFDPLYSMMPPLVCNEVEHNHRHYYQQNQNYNEKSSVENHALTGGSLPLAGSVMGSVDYMRHSISSNGASSSSSFHMNSSISPQPTTLYNNSPGYVGIQPYLVSPLHQPQQVQIIRPDASDSMQQPPHLTTLTNVQYNQSQSSTNAMNDMESSFTPSSIASSDDPQISHHFYFDSNNQSHYKLPMSEMLIQPNSFIPDSNNSFGDDQIYSRFKRKSSLSFTPACNNNNLPLSISNASPHSYQTNNLNSSQPNSCRSKLQKTTSTNLPQVGGGASVSSPIQATTIMSSNYNHVSSQNYSLTNKSSSSSISSLSTSSSPISPNVTPLRNQSDIEINNQNKNQVDNELSLITNTIQNGHNHHSQNQHLDRTTSLSTSSYLKTQSFSLQPDCNNKYVQEWIFMNRFSHLLHLFSNYTSNDVLRLSKDDLIKLCGAPDGIRLFNLAHNIQIKSKLTIFVTFQNCLTYFSAIFMADWKCKSLIKRLTLLYSSFVRNLSGSHESKLNKLLIKDEQIVENNAPHTSPSNIYLEDDENENNEESCENIDKTGDDISYSKQMSTDEKKSKENQDHLHLFDEMLVNEFKYELFIKLKGILVKTTDEVLNNLVDQSRFLIQFEPASLNIHQDKANLAVNTSLLDKNSLIKIIMIPLN